MSVEEAIQHLATYGYCALEDRIPAEQAQSMAKKYLELHVDPADRSLSAGSSRYQTVFGILNLDDTAWSCATHPDVLAVARHFLGERIRIVSGGCSKVTYPGAADQSLHVDSAGFFHEVPNVPWLINTIWMLTDFTVENGATGVVPMSHLSRRNHPPEGMRPDHPLVKPVTGPAGSVLMWHSGLFHTARANHSDQIRVGLNMGYYPCWFNNWMMDGHQPIWPETYERMPVEMRALCPGRLAKNRSDLYENP